jgi:hypothetical protein
MLSQSCSPTLKNWRNSGKGARQTLHFIPDTSSYEALKNSGVLERLQGQDIERLLSDYYDVLGNIQHLESEQNEFIKPFGIQFERSTLKDVEEYAFNSAQGIQNK